MRYSFRVNQGAHIKAPPDASDGRHFPLPKADCHTQNCPSAGLGVMDSHGVHALACPQMGSFAAMSGGPGHPKGWTPNILGPSDQVNVCDFIQPKTDLNRAIPASTGIRMKNFFSRNRNSPTVIVNCRSIPSRLPAKTVARMSRSERLHSGRITSMLRIRIYGGAIIAPRFD
jgi:hypothetical protein